MDKRYILSSKNPRIGSGNGSKNDLKELGYILSRIGERKAFKTCINGVLLDEKRKYNND